MSKDWLIRTHTNRILGPVSREKIQDLLGKGSLIPEDEVCCGNGYWIYIRESDLIKRFIHEAEMQPFNPISEAMTVLTKDGVPSVPVEETPSSPSVEPEKTPEPPTQTRSVGEDDTVLPDSEDLEYPDLSGSVTMGKSDADDATLVGKLPEGFTSSSEADLGPVNDSGLELAAAPPEVPEESAPECAGDGLNERRFEPSDTPAEEAAMSEDGSIMDSPLYPSNQDLEYPNVDDIVANVDAEIEENLKKKD